MVYQYEPNDDIKDQVRIIMRNFNEIQVAYNAVYEPDTCVYESKKHIIIIDNACSSCQELLRCYKTGVKYRTDLEFLIRKAKHILAKLPQTYDDITRTERDSIYTAISLLQLRFDGKFLDE
ncbi:hypothetical protein [Liquorilactobacillus sucicola]|nr:hypothetical protein [Liquorilactobacillus sucicola]